MAEAAPSARWMGDRASFLEFLEQQSERWEFFSHILRAMVGGTIRHAMIAKNVVQRPDEVIGEGPCRALPDGVRLEPEHNQDATFPGAMVVCEPVSETATAVSRPTVIVEVLSRSTEVFARGPKWESDQAIPTLRHYVLVSHDKAAVEVFSRSGAGGDWTFRRAAGLDAVIDLEAIGARLPLAGIYRGTDIARR